MYQPPKNLVIGTNPRKASDFVSPKTDKSGNMQYSPRDITPRSIDRQIQEWHKMVAKTNDEKMKQELFESIGLSR